MKKIIILMGVFAIAFSSCGTGSKALKTEQDSVAYALGIDLGNYVKNVDSTLNVDILAAAIKDVLKNEAKITQEDGYNYLREVFGVRKPQREKESGDKWVREMAEGNSKAKTSESGLVYEIVEQGDMNTVVTGDQDTVYVVYHGTKRNGEVFDSSFDRGDTTMLPLNNVIKGWQEGIKLIGKGGKIVLWVPSDLAYGAGGAGHAIGANEALKFEVTLVDISHAEEQK